MALVLNGKQAGLALGGLFAILHAAWSLIVASGNGQGFLDFFSQLHFLTPETVTAFDPMNAAILVATTFVVGYIIGWLFAWLWNWAGKKV